MFVESLSQLSQVQWHFGENSEKYDKIVNMKKEKDSLASRLIGAGVLTASAQFYHGSGRPLKSTGLTGGHDFSTLL